MAIGLITKEEGEQILSEAAQSDVGKPRGSGSFGSFTLMLLMFLAFSTTNSL